MSSAQRRNSTWLGVVVAVIALILAGWWLLDRDDGASAARRDDARKDAGSEPRRLAGGRLLPLLSGPSSSSLRSARGCRPLAGAGLMSSWSQAMAQCSAARSSAISSSSLQQKARTRGAILRHHR